MHRAEADLRKQLPYRGQIESIIGNLLSADAEFSSPLTEQREVKRVGIVVLGSDDGLCGGYNINIFKELLARLRECRSEYGEGVDFTIFTVGRKIHKAVAKLVDPHITVSHAEEVNSKSGYDAVKAFAASLSEQYLAGQLDTVKLLYMNFQSVSRQRLRYEQYLPVDASTFSAEGAKAQCRPYIFEPDAASIFRSVLPMFLLSVMQEVFTENRASEQAARIMAMQSANDNAKNLLEQLQLEYNKLRQQSITTELLDILGGQVKN